MSRVWTKVVSYWDGEKYVTDMEQSEWFDYDGPVAECKGSDVAKQQMEQQNKLQQQAFDLMQARQNQVNDPVGKYLSGDIGYDPAQLATMRAQFLNSMGKNYATAGANLRTALLRRGSLDSTAPVGGDYVRGTAALEGGLASDSSSGLANIDLTNLQQALTNKFNAASLINGQAAQLTSPISTFGSGASSALNSYITAANSGFLSSLARGFGGALGGGLGIGAVGGLGGVLSGGNFGKGFSGVFGGK